MMIFQINRLLTVIYIIIYLLGILLHLLTGRTEYSNSYLFPGYEMFYTWKSKNLFEIFYSTLFQTLLSIFVFAIRIPFYIQVLLSFSWNLIFITQRTDEHIVSKKKNRTRGINIFRMVHMVLLLTNVIYHISLIGNTIGYILGFSTIILGLLTLLIRSANPVDSVLSKPEIRNLIIYPYGILTNVLLLYILQNSPLVISNVRLRDLLR